MTHIGVITFPGALDDQDAVRAVHLAGGEPTALWHKDSELHGVDAIVIPGGFSYGDYLRCGAIATTVPVMREIIEQAGKGVPVLGICNGFQILCEAHLLPGALIRNDHQKFLCRGQVLRIENSDTMRTKSFTRGDLITVLLKNGEGNFQASPEELERLEGEGRVVFRYMEGNPNGLVKDIAGTANDAGNVVSLMPHPEHVIESGFGPLSVDASGAHLGHGGTQGLGIFQSALASLPRWPGIRQHQRAHRIDPRSPGH